MQNIAQYNSDYMLPILSQACKNQTRSMQICHKVTLPIGKMHAQKKMSRNEGQFPKAQAQIHIKVNKTIPTSSPSKVNVYKNDTIYIPQNLHK